MKRISFFSILLVLICTKVVAINTEIISLDGAWEMSYSSNECPPLFKHLPEFHGKIIENAVPGYWEDMFDVEHYNNQPMCHRQTLPNLREAEELTFPHIYGTFFYRRNITLDHGGKAFLKFQGVRNQVHVWVNGQHVAFRQGFSTPFELEIPDGILHKGDNTLVLAVSNNPNMGYCGFVTGLTTRAVFNGTGGINGHLELEFPANDIRDVYVTTSHDLKTFTVHVEGQTPYDWEIEDVAKGSAKGDFSYSTEGLKFWSPDSPYMYNLKLTAPGWEYSIRFGIRRLQPDGESLRLNGDPIYLRGVTEHCYYPLTVHMPRDIEYYRMVARKRKELGFNFVRFHTHVPPVEYLQACDEYGILVHIESPNLVEVSEYEAIIKFARQHPCVVIYCTGNETRIDDIAEVYLSQIADRVHTMTDGLFSPKSALRGMEYFLIPPDDVIENTPFEHNPARFERINKFADVYTSFLNCATSYSALNPRPSAEDVDSWGDVYQRPRLSHELCIDGTYVDLSTEKLYPEDSPVLKAGLFSEVHKMLELSGITEEKANLYYRNSCQWQRRCRKHCFEKIRSMKRVAGYDFLGDINTHWHTFGYSVGMMDEFYRLKPTETVENVLRYNSPAVLLNDMDSYVNFYSGTSNDITFRISNFLEEMNGGILTVSLVNEKGRTVYKKVFAGIDAPIGEITDLQTVKVEFPKSSAAHGYMLKAVFSCAGKTVENEWEVYAFPKVTPEQPTGVKVVNNLSKEDLIAAMKNGESVVLFGSGPFNSVPSTYQIGLPGRSWGNYSTVVKNHPALKDFPHDGFCGWQFRKLMEGGYTVQLEAGIPFDPIIDVASSVKVPIRQSFLFEYRVGSGRLLVCSFKFNESDPAAPYLKSKILAYAKDMNPQQQITPEHLAAVIDAPKIMYKNGNVGIEDEINYFKAKEPFIK